MAALKRKRGENASSRKLRKLSPASDDTPSEPDHAMEDENENDDDEEGEEEEWGGISGTITERPSAFGTKSLKPTGEEIRAIKDASDLFRSNTFKLQIDALLPNVRPKPKHIPPLERFLLSLHTFLSNIPSTAPQHPLEAARSLLKKGVAVPYSAPLPNEDTQWKVAFAPPSDITLVGSWANKTFVKQNDGGRYGVDLAVEMPSSLFQEKDYLNGRFFQKKAFYLATIAAAITHPNPKTKTGPGLNVDVSYVSTNDDPRLTKLVLEPKTDGSPNDFTKLKARVYIIPVLSSDSPIPLHRLSPAHANLRVTGANENDHGHPNTKPSLPSPPSPPPPSPLYNTALLTSLTPRTFLLSTHAAQQKVQDVPSFNDAVALLRVWANQRGYGGGSGDDGGEAGICVRGFDGKGPWWSALVMFLILGEEPTSAAGKRQRKPLGRGLSSYQLFRAALDFLAKHDFERIPVFVRCTEGHGHRYTPDEYASHHELVFVDSSSTVNLLAGVPVGSMKLLSADAQKTLEILNNTPASVDPFPEVFLKDHRDIQARFDTVIHVDLTTIKPRNPSLHETLDSGSASNALLSSLTSLLTRGLGNRIKTLAILHPASSSSSLRPLSQAHPSTGHAIHIGLIYDTQHAFRQVDHGPSAAESDVSAVERDQFRDFWGDKAELRRFKDGSITESVVWDVKSLDEKAHIPCMIVRHVLQRHFDLGTEAVHTWGTSFDSLLRLPESVSRYYVGSGLGIGSKGAITAFDKLVKAIRALDESKVPLPLSVLNVSPTAEPLRYTSVFSPLPLPPSIATILPPNARYLQPMEVVLEFEKSSRWPDDLRAIQKVKLAFLERIARGLMSREGQGEGLKASVVVGDDGSSTREKDSEIQDVARLEIITEEGWAFSLRIWNDREATLLDRIINDTAGLPHVTVKSSAKGEKKGKEYHDALRAREVYTRRYVHAPQHHRAVAKLCHSFPAFAGTVRLVKRWFAAHWLLGCHISEEVVELLCAKIFVGNGEDWEREVENARERDGADEGGKGGLGSDRLAPSVPGSKERGFALVMRFLKEWKWEEGVFVPLYGSEVSTAKQPRAITTATTGVWKVSTRIDEEGVIWTMRGPDAVVARRVNALAEATWTHMRDMEMSGRSDVRSMFDHPSENYDVVIKLDPSVLPRYHQNVVLDEARLSRHADDEMAAVIRPGFDPARNLCRDLQNVYQDTFRIFHDYFGGDRFGAVWDLSLKDPRPFRVLGGFSSLPLTPAQESASKKVKNKDLVALNEQGVLGEIERTGKGIIQGITVHVEG